MIPYQNIVVKPKYIKQPPYRYCGHCQIKIIKEFFDNQENKPKINIHFMQYSPNSISKISGFILPKAMRIYLAKINIEAKKIKNQKSQNINDIFQTYKSEIDCGKIILMTVGHGYTKNKNKFSVVRGILLQHWISVWGYNETGVYIYDSSCIEQFQLPIGNLHLSREVFAKAYKYSLIKTAFSIQNK